MLVNVCYRAPVVCVVDTDTKRILRVTVDDESISGPEYCETAEGCATLASGSKVARAAVKIAEGEAWPGWEFGF